MKDQCDICTGYNVGSVMEEEYSLNVIPNETARVQKERQKELARSKPSKLICTVSANGTKTSGRCNVLQEEAAECT